jgi:hypothetical protein
MAATTSGSHGPSHWKKRCASGCRTGAVSPVVSSVWRRVSLSGALTPDAIRADLRGSACCGGGAHVRRVTVVHPSSVLGGCWDWLVPQCLGLLWGSHHQAYPLLRAQEEPYLPLWAQRDRGSPLRGSQGEPCHPGKEGALLGCRLGVDGNPLLGAPLGGIGHGGP